MLSIPKKLAVIALFLFLLPLLAGAGNAFVSCLHPAGTLQVKYAFDGHCDRTGGGSFCGHGLPDRASGREEPSCGHCRDIPPATTILKNRPRSAPDQPPVANPFPIPKRLTGIGPEPEAPFSKASPALLFPHHELIVLGTVILLI